MTNSHFGGEGVKELEVVKIKNFFRKLTQNGNACYQTKGLINIYNLKNWMHYPSLEMAKEVKKIYIYYY